MGMQYTGSCLDGNCQALLQDQKCKALAPVPRCIPSMWTLSNFWDMQMSTQLVVLEPITILPAALSGMTTVTYKQAPN